MNAMTAALERAGFSKREMEAFGLALKFIKANGTLEEWIKAYERAAERIGSQGHAPITARSGHKHHAEASDPIPEGQEQLVHDDQLRTANGKPASGEATVALPKGHPRSTSTARGPSSGFIRATRAILEITSVSIFDVWKTSDGVKWGDVCAHELPGMTRDGVIAQAIQEVLGPLNDKERFKPLRKLMKAASLADVRARLEQANDD